MSELVEKNQKVQLNKVTNSHCLLWPLNKTHLIEDPSIQVQPTLYLQINVDSSLKLVFTFHFLEFQKKPYRQSDPPLTHPLWHRCYSQGRHLHSGPRSVALSKVEYIFIHIYICMYLLALKREHWTVGLMPASHVPHSPN